MTSLPQLASQPPDGLGSSMTALIAELYPLCRSITGSGLRRTLEIVRRTLPLQLHEVPTGTPVFDWTVPREWNIRDAWVADAHGQRVIDFRACNLHVVNYSVPVRRRMTLEQLRPHLHTLPDHPDWIPYRTTYYDETWGFCLRHRDYLTLPPGEYEVVIDSTLEDGALTYGELLLPGASQDEVLLTTHACHPSMCNDNLSGIAVLSQLAAALQDVSRRYSYRILFLPGTIGAITWLARNREATARIRHGLVLAGLGDRGGLCYKRSRQGQAQIDRAVQQVLRESGAPHRVLDFSPYGYDERQFCSPGFDLAVGRLSRSEYGTYPEYHTSADDLDFVTEASLVDSWVTLARVLSVLEANDTFVNRLPWCEPQLGKRGLYASPGDGADWEQVRLALLWVLNLSDGTRSLLDIVQRSGLPFPAVLQAAQRLEGAGLLERRPR